MLKKIKGFIVLHKIISAIIFIILVIGVYFLIKNSGNSQISYVTENVKLGNIETLVTGTGQVEASNSITLKPKTTGDITSVKVVSGQEVKKGQLIASVDSRDAKIALENAQIALDKLTSPNSLTVLENKNSLDKSYGDGWNSVASFVTDTTSLVNDMDDIYSNDGFLGNSNILNKGNTARGKVMIGENSFYKAKKNFEEVVNIYKNLSSLSDKNDINNLLSQAYESSKLMSIAVKNTEEAFNYIVDISNSSNDSVVISNRTNISSLVDNSNNYVSDLLSSKNQINENNLSYIDDSDIRSAQLSLQAKKDAYNDCFILAPFDGVIATLTAKVGESSGSSIGTLITKQKVATISLNEVDVASVLVGQKATLTFDAINDLIISGTIVEIDSVGAVNSGVVTYDVKIAFDKDDQRVKAGMSTNVEIVTQSKKNILTVSSSAVKTKNGSSYVLVFESLLAEEGNSQGVVSSVPPTKREVVIGISDDTLTEIVSGLKEGDQIVLKTVTSGSSSSSSSNKSSNSIMGGGPSPMGGSVMGGVMH